jgi:hypothetical protein
LTPDLDHGEIMTPDELRDSLQERPFRPFRLMLSDGTGYDIRHPELLWVGQNSAYVGLTGSASQTFFERSVKLSLHHITQIVPIDELTPPAVGAAGG